ncbi:MAG: glycosyltransferase [Acidobacteria bacterium]|nr:glycosyltransferase [Acidobacteriota bacterium]
MPPEELSPEPPSLLAVVYYYPPVNAVGALRPARFVKYLQSEFGYRAFVVAARTQDDLSTSETVSFVPAPRRSPAEQVSHFLARVIHKLGLLYSDRLDWIHPATKAASALLRQRKVDLLLTSFPPLSSAFTGLLLKWRFGTTWIADFRDPFAESPFRTNVRFRFLELPLERAIIGSADLVLTVTDALARELQHRHPRHAGKIHVIWNGFDPAEAFPAVPKPPRPFELLLHAGDLYGARHPGVLLDAIWNLSQRGRLDLNRHRFLQIGPQESPGLVQHASFEKLKSSGYLSIQDARISRSQALTEIASADRLLLLDMNDSNVGHTVPAKLFDYVRAEHPLLAFTPQASVVSQILAKSEIPHVAIDPRAQPDRVEQSVMEFFSMPATPRRAGPWFWDTFDGLHQVRQLSALIDRLPRR